MNPSIVAVDLGGTKLSAGRVEADAVTQQCSRAVPPTDDDQVVLKELIGAIHTVFDSKTSAIGVGVPSVVDVERGIVYNVQNIPSWKEVHLKEILEREFQVPVYVNNDANCFALGECHFGKGRNFRHILGLTLGTGLGGGIIIDRKLYSGSNCGAGEIGMIPYKGEILESYCAGQMFLRECGVSGEVVFERAVAGDPEALSAYERYGQELATALVIALYAFDPEIVIFGGSISKAYRFFKQSMLKNLSSLFAYQHALQRLTIEISELPDVALLGAAALYLNALSDR